ncbi:fimbria/pilus periplasmic chaperone [Sphingomonas sp. LY29]|uniref:fimbrial biogenesis chaperone n=1 Tax=Sphingomonas sp. LY29 TaxID=3095341 RepID=UPI002D79F653|nr:fimbria/pilus periplasmic chaperone [Sphingomonas sp. LY29]WRP26415.1 fimbria/pilus periplasmic chaperone [Sphingomonas sp. LY29]
MRKIAFLRASLMMISATLFASPASAQISVSQLIVELNTENSAADLEVVNDSGERAYVTVTPRQIQLPGTPAESSFSTPNPETLGLLVSPSRLILEPNQRRRLRIARVGASSDHEKIYRVTVKPVTGEIEATQSGIKMLVGYDLLVISRPVSSAVDLKKERTGSTLTIRNDGASSVELVEGKLCLPTKVCSSIPGRRIYAGAIWSQPIPPTGTGEFRVKSMSGWSTLKF